MPPAWPRHPLASGLYSSDPRPRDFLPKIDRYSAPCSPPGHGIPKHLGSVLGLTTLRLLCQNRPDPAPTVRR
eukprot:78276-Pyramimonas_sp.AAC.1